MIFEDYFDYIFLTKTNTFQSNPEATIPTTRQVTPSNDDGIWESTTGFGLDLPSYEDALEMPKVEETPKPKGVDNAAFMNELPPEYSENDRITFETRNSMRIIEARASTDLSVNNGNLEKTRKKKETYEKRKNIC